MYYYLKKYYGSLNAIALTLFSIKQQILAS